MKKKRIPTFYGRCLICTLLVYIPNICLSDQLYRKVSLTYYLVFKNLKKINSTNILLNIFVKFKGDFWKYNIHYEV